MQDAPRKCSKDPIGVVFGATVRRLRERHGWTQEQLAELAEMSATYVGFVERGENVPTLTIIFRLADALEVTPAELIDDAARRR
jgi:transcriptional regulator with XRE-family HTH domain